MSTYPLSEFELGSIPVSYTDWIARTLDLPPSEYHKLIKGTALTPLCLSDPASRISPKDQLQVVSNAIALSDDEDFGLQLGKILTPSTHGPLGHLVLCSPNLTKAIDCFIQYVPTRLPILRFSPYIQGKWLCIDVAFVGQISAVLYRILSEAYAVSLQSLAEFVVGRPLTDAEFHFTYDPPRYDYGRYLNAHCQFSQPRQCIRVPLTTLALANQASNYSRYQSALAECRQQMKALKRSSNGQVSAQVKAQILARPDHLLSEKQAAQLLNITPRTLARRLAKEGTSFRKVRDEQLAALARQYLADPALPSTVIGELLGYPDPANFRRTFKRWFGVPPSQFRARSRGN